MSDELPFPQADSKPLPPTPNESTNRLVDVFVANRHRRFLFVRPGGNCGDYLIYRGAETLADRVGLTWITIDLLHDKRLAARDDDVVYVHGGGGFNGWCSGNAERTLSLAVSQHRGLVIQGPQTFDRDSSYAEMLFSRLTAARECSRLVVFAREHITHSILTAVSPHNVEIRLDHDTALQLAHTDLRPSAWPLWLRYKLIALRTDNESSFECTTPSRMAAICVDPPRVCRNFAHWLDIHRHSAQIITNRTHSAIVGALFGVPTTLLPGAYHKNRSIWEYSLKERGVRWANSLDELDLNTPHSQWPIHQIAFESLRANVVVRKIARRFRRLARLPHSSNAWS